MAKKDDSFLRIYFKDCQEAMRWRATNEFRILQFVLVIYPAVLTGLAYLFASMTRIPYMILSATVGVFLVGLTWWIDRKVRADHKVYADIGKVVDKIWSYFGLFESGAYVEGESILPPSLKGKYGSGPGHKYTLRIVYALTVGSVVLTWILCGARAILGPG